MSRIVEISVGGVAVASLANWRITHALWGEDGPWDLFARTRTLAGAGVLGRILDCFYCLSLWLALPFAPFVSESPVGMAIAWLAISGAAILLERVTVGSEAEPTAATWREIEPTTPDTPKEPD